LLPLARRIERNRAARTSKLRVEVLSGRVHLGSELLALRERELELLVMLALERRALTREALATRLWPEIPSDEANAALRTAVYRLRKQLREPDAIVSTAAGYRLAESIPVDVLEAEQFVAGTRRLVALSERERARLGTLLGRLSDGLPSVYARWEWFGSYEQRVRDLLHDVGVALAEDDLRRGDNDAAIARAQTLLRADELDEPANEVAIRAHVAAGRKSEALRRYRRYRDALQREYGVAPSSELSDLLEPR
jgi:DNA-binding SARP family transcriptional activator